MTRVLSAVAWPYTNGPRHIGHVAGFGVPSDVFSRFMRMAGHDVLMVSGTDEHGTPITVAADAEAGDVSDVPRAVGVGPRDGGQDVPISHASNSTERRPAGSQGV